MRERIKDYRAGYKVLKPVGACNLRYKLSINISDVDVPATRQILALQLYSRFGFLSASPLDDHTLSSKTQFILDECAGWHACCMLKQSGIYVAGHAVARFMRFR